MPAKKKDNNEPKKAKPGAADKSFGMKNKKGAAAQKQIQQWQKQEVAGGSAEEKRKQALREQKEKDKLAAEAARAEAAELFKPAQTQKVPLGVDPKSVLCDFFKKGICEKGKKCKFSHDLEVGRKAQKRDLYQDSRESEKEEKEKDKMEEWDEEKLRKVVLSKHGNPKTTTDKVCKFFIQAIEDGKYGWFWTCPNGGDKCMYRHSLPPGFVIKTKEQRAAEKALMEGSPLHTLTLEDFLESERHKLTGTLTPVTPDSFAKWKKERLDKKAAEQQALSAKEATGRAMFESGDWQRGDSSEEDDDDDEDDDGTFSLENLRKETERLRQRKEEERLAKLHGHPLPDVDGSIDGSAPVTAEGSVAGDDDDSGAEAKDGLNGEHPAEVSVAS